MLNNILLISVITKNLDNHQHVHLC